MQRLDLLVTKKSLANIQQTSLFVVATKGMVQQAKCAARAFKASANCIMVADQRMAKLMHLPNQPLVVTVSPTTVRQEPVWLMDRAARIDPSEAALCRHCRPIARM